jgi:protein TonB
MRTGLWRIVAAVLFALVTISYSKLSAQSSAPSSATPPAPSSAAPANSSSGASAGAGTTAIDAGQPKNVGGGVTGPVVIKQPEPEFTEEARQKPMNAIVTVSLIVDQRGMPQNVHVTRGVGMGLDENAVKAVKKYRFKPAMENGKPVAVYLNVQVHFVIFDKNGFLPPDNTIQP